MNTPEEKFQNYSNASRLRQAAIPPQVRKARAAQAANARWQNKSPEERRAHALKMVEARQFGRLKKKDGTTNN